MGYTKLKRTHLIRHQIHKATSSEYLRVLILRTIGNLLILSSLFMIGKTFYQPVKEEVIYAFNTALHKKYIVANTKQQAKTIQKIEVQQQKTQPKGFLAKAINFKPVDVLTPIDANFGIVIPKIGANAKIIPNVDAANETEYLAALKEGVAHVKGSAFPGEGGAIYLFAHSTDYFWNVGTYNAIFYLLYKLEPNDEVDLFFKGQRYTYRVIDKKIVDPSQVEYLTRKTNREFLTLQTCWPPGTTLQRLLVFAVRVAE